MPRKGKGSQSANANSLRAKAAANAAIAAHGAASSSTGQHSSAHANQSPSGSSRRQRDAYIDAEDMIGLDDDLDDQDQDMAIEEAHNEDEEAEVQHAMQIIEAAEAGDQSHASDAGPREESASPDSSPEPDDMPLIGAGLDDSMQHDEHEDDDEEQVRDDGDDDDEEDDEIMPGQEGEMLDDEFDAPLTFDADGNPLGPAGGVPPEEGEGEDPESDNEMMEGEGGEGGLRAAVAAAAAADEGFGSFAASLRGYSGLMANMSGRLRTILASLKNRSDPSGRMAALQELSELLSMATEDTLAGYFSVDAFVKELITVLKGSGGGTNPQAAYGLGDDDEDDDYAMAQAIAAAADAEEANGGENQEEMQLLACRCLANLIEALPHSSHNIVSNGAVPVLCSKLIEITFIDLAEQTISVSFPNQILCYGTVLTMSTDPGEAFRRRPFCHRS
jgi:E3 ubiquitin-protein ligase TRIP12